MKYVIHIDCFTTALDDLTQTQKRNLDQVLFTLEANPRFSVFEATADPFIARTLDKLRDEGYFTLKDGIGYPWHEAELTDKGRTRLEAWKLSEQFKIPARKRAKR